MKHIVRGVAAASLAQQGDRVTPIDRAATARGCHW